MAGGGSASGVLGATGSLAKSLGSTATSTSTSLPFTGLPLWVPLLIGLGLLGSGLTLRRSRAGL